MTATAAEAGMETWSVGRVVVMGVSGSGKSTVGAALAARLGWSFVDGDDLHPVENIRKMSGGQPLTDADRAPWLREVGLRLQASPGPIVIACSALRRRYRDIIRREEPTAFFVHLHGAEELLAGRLAARTAHFMPGSLLPTQLALVEPLESDERGGTVDVVAGPDEVVELVLRGLGQFLGGF